MKKCPSCSLLLTDSTPECPRCHVPVEVTVSKEQLQERNKKDWERYRKRVEIREARSLGAIPPWAPPVAVPGAGVVVGLFIYAAMIRTGMGDRASATAMNALFATLGMVVLNALIVYVGIWFIEERPRIEPCLMASALMFVIPYAVGFAFLLAPGLLYYLILGFQTVVIYFVIAGSFDVEMPKAAMLWVLETMLVVGGSHYATNAFIQSITTAAT